MLRTNLKSLIALAVLAAAVTGLGAGTESRHFLTINGKLREYVLYVPANAGSNPPVVFSLHGMWGRVSHYYEWENGTYKLNSNSERIEKSVENLTLAQVTGTDPNATGIKIDTNGGREPFAKDVADSVGCVVVYPQGANHWLLGNLAPGWDSFGYANDDHDFFMAIINELDRTHKLNINHKRIYCCGFSNGGMMTYSNASTAADVFAAFASICGYQINETHHRITGARPVPFMHLHGTDDGNVLFNLSPIIRDRMIARNGCNPIPVVTQKEGVYTKSVYEAGAGGFPYVYYEIIGRGHVASSSRTEDNSSSRTMWNFMSQYTLDDPCDTTLKWRVNIDTPGWKPEEHGWTVNAKRTRFAYGTGKTHDDHNVYHSLQFDPGHYKLCFSSKGVKNHRADGNKIFVKLETVEGQTIFSQSGRVWKDVVIPFEITAYSECKITIVKENAADYFTDFTIYSCEKKNEGANNQDEVMPGDGHLIEIPQDQGVGLDNSSRTKVEAGDGCTIYTADSGIQVAFKMKNLDVTGCDYVVIKFAEPVPSGSWWVSFTSGTIDLPKNSTEYVFTFSDSIKKSGILPECTLLTSWGTPSNPVIKVAGVYKHHLPEEPEPEPVHLIEIPQDQGRQYDSFSRSDLVEGEKYNTYTSTKDLQIAFKMMNLDVRNCDYVIVKFAEPVKKGWYLAFWKNQDLESVPEGTSAFKFGLEPEMIQSGILPQICLMTFFGGYTSPLEAKVTGIYKHCTRWCGFKIAIQ